MSRDEVREQNRIWSEWHVLLHFSGVREFLDTAGTQHHSFVVAGK